ncbi:efflux RND transporter permease subunit [Marinobacterium arenosum]|uniref:efflux RND transporter permease subunit n=1 Tax=Marinobacterium arenosum TaxID=2862496 RepID=UPI001C95090D|nr:efflux RND transporter permease subunit [Marinobacterium arenosum]MBY4677521.1 efflux RND transporter permease subunit [Marinobacterium arenosum]
MLQRLIGHHVLANLLFVLVLVLGTLAYNLLPRQQDPTINFNWIVVTTVLPGASAEDIERRVTDPLEEAIQNISDIKFASSNSREGVSSLLIRFEDIDARTFDKRINDLRREIQNAEDELPEAASDPVILELTSANAFPSVTVAVVGQADDENLRLQARNIEKDLERLAGVDRVDPIGLDDPELQVNFDPQVLQALQLSPTLLADSVALWFRDISAGSVDVGGNAWLIRLAGRDASPDRVKQMPLVGLGGQELTLDRVAEVVRAREKASQEAIIDGKPAIVMAVMKKGDANTIDLVERVKAYMAQRNELKVQTGAELVLVDDQTVPTREAITLMQNNAMIGLLLVLLVAWLFLGTRIALLTAIGIPFILAGTFWVLWMTGETLNVTVLLGVVIVLGMLVDDAVVVVEAIYHRLQQGIPVMDAALQSLREVGRPVTSAVLTTIAAFMPLMLLPGILGDFMRVIPMVVTIALAISLIEAFWMLPAHVSVARISFERPSRMQLWRIRNTRRVQIFYIRMLVKALRRPAITLSLMVLLFLGSLGVVSAGLIKMDFFAADPLRLFYVNIEMPAQTPLATTLDKVREAEQLVRRQLRPEDMRAVVGYAGQQFTETAPQFGEQYGQILVGLKPKSEQNRSVDQLIEAVRADVQALAGPVNVSFLRLAGGPPVSKPISVKVRGDEYAEIRAAADALKSYMASQSPIIDISDDAGGGRMTLTLTPDYDAIARTGLAPLEVLRTAHLLVDGEIVADMQHQGDKLEVRVRAKPASYSDVDQLLSFRLPTPAGGQVPLSELVHAERGPGLGNIRHYNFRRAITVEADLKPDSIDTVTANNLLIEHWNSQLQGRFPNVDLDFSGELDDIQESIDAIALLFVFGIGVMYLILGTQFSSYWQPFMILATVPMAFTGVVMGLLLTQNPLSLFTLYGVVALAGIAVNAAIVLISAANARLARGMSVLHATLYAARRRVIPILITSLTTIAGLSSLALGLGGKSLIWGPVATAIVSGLAFSTVLTLFVVPTLYRLSMGRAAKRRAARSQSFEPVAE